MNELLQNIDMNGAGLLFLRIVLVLIMLISAIISAALLRNALYPYEGYWGDTDDDLKLSLGFALACIASIAFLFGALP